MSRKNNTYPTELKLEVVQAYLAGEESMQKIAEKYEIRNVSQVKVWVREFKEVESIDAFNRLPSAGSGAKGIKNPLKGKRIHFKDIEEERDYYKARITVTIDGRYIAST
ncbi:helix-turn-helix domain-containing protein [Lysinibacillus fusiformis]|nr:helix-turn-helix domain-containing protein [Lysinibacillus fusiformis]MED4078208.1 transposase [Lysinibacillus fusiformis]SCX41538.1 Helix-turn-helix domain-containing protein [Lysinibacillus fusiformis]SDB10768.1 Helix-turn-helix domain-containing protein [Lysinibacillus fusiformis]SFH87732.1 Helix-turn-helix domain-containing protein [Lysinibacillus fusiformis]SFS32909.1 Helix-turn-helix domain-containing protein [Lysinibacillus fusiformis]